MLAECAGGRCRRTALPEWQGDTKRWGICVFYLLTQQYLVIIAFLWMLTVNWLSHLVWLHLSVKYLDICVKILYTYLQVTTGLFNSLLSYRPRTLTGDLMRFLYKESHQRKCDVCVPFPSAVLQIVFPSKSWRRVLVAVVANSH